MIAQASPIPGLPFVLPLPVIRAGLPLLFEDDEAEALDMGENNLHWICEHILKMCIQAHLCDRPELRVYANMNLYYPSPPDAPATTPPYVSPDVMVVKPSRPLPLDLSSYHLGADGPAPLSVVEVLSERTAQEGDLGDKLIVYALLGVPEYILVDVRRRYMPVPILLKRLQPDRSWVDAPPDADGGVTSHLGFRITLAADGCPHVLDAVTGRTYIRPDEAEGRVREEAEARTVAEEGRTAAEEKARIAEAKARAAVRGQAAAEAQARKDAVARNAAEEQARKEAAARATAEEQARKDAAALAAAEDRLRQIEADLRRFRGDS